MVTIAFVYFPKESPSPFFSSPYIAKDIQERGREKTSIHQIRTESRKDTEESKRYMYIYEYESVHYIKLCVDDVVISVVIYKNKSCDEV